MKHIIEFNMESGNARFLHDDRLVGLVPGRMRTVRASHIVFNEDAQEWEVRHATDDRLLFSSSSNAECYAWEKAHFNQPPR